jgi:hypothetical protein
MGKSPSLARVAVEFTSDLQIYRLGAWFKTSLEKCRSF